MHWRNSREEWGIISISLHWLIAVVIFAMFGLGLYMTDLTLYDPWYHKAPHIHRSIGVLLFIITAFRLLWRFSAPVPAAMDNHAPWERVLAKLVHLALYLLMFALMISGYLITTADGRPVYVFDWFNVPATLTLNHQEDIAGEIHEVLAWTLISLALLHAAAAFKHHLIDKDRTLTRMLGLPPPSQDKGVRS